DCGFVELLGDGNCRRRRKESSWTTPPYLVAYDSTQPSGIMEHAPRTTHHSAGLTGARPSEKGVSNPKFQLVEWSRLTMFIHIPTPEFLASGPRVLVIAPPPRPVGGVCETNRTDSLAYVSARPCGFGLGPFCGLLGSGRGAIRAGWGPPDRPLQPG